MHPAQVIAVDCRLENILSGEFKRFLLLASDKRDSTRRLRKFLAPSDKVLDIGSLDAPYTRELSNEVVAIDIPPNGIFGYSDDGLKARQGVRPGFKPMHANAEKMPFEDRVLVCSKPRIAGEQA